MQYGFFSKEHEAFIGSVVYKRPDGSKVHVTALSEDANYGTDPKRYGAWADNVCVGEVTDYVGPGRLAENAEEDFEPMTAEAIDKEYEFV